MPTDQERCDRAYAWLTENIATVNASYAAQIESVLVCSAGGYEAPAALAPVGAAAQLCNALLGEQRFEAAAYNNEYEAGEHITYKWAHAKLAGLAMPALVLPETDGYDLTHAIYSSSDYGNLPLQSTEAVSRIEAALATETAWDLIGEYLTCLIILGQTPDTTVYEAWWDEDWTGKGFHPVVVGAFLFALRL